MNNQIKQIRNSKKGFTLIELLLYIGIAGVMMFSLVAFLMIILQAQIKSRTISDVEQQGVQIMQIITQTIRNAEGINSPSSGNSSGSTSINVVNAGDDPTVFNLSSGVIRITEGAGSAVDLNNSRVVASGLNFYNLTRSGTYGVVRIQFTLTHVNPDGRNEYDYSKTFYGTASLRQ